MVGEDRLSTLLFVIAAAAAIQFPSRANAEQEAAECYDAVVVATPVRQISTPLPYLGPDEIVMRWPWFLDLHVHRVLEGDIKRGRLSALSVQHTYFIKKRFRMWLRRNFEGSFNVIELAEVDGTSNIPQCVDAPPARPHIQPGPGETLRDLRARSERQQ